MLSFTSKTFLHFSLERIRNDRDHTFCGTKCTLGRVIPQISPLFAFVIDTIY